MARTEALRLLGVRAAGGDPANERDRGKTGATVAHMGERFLQEYVARHCKPRTAEEYRRAVEQCINPVLGNHLVSDVTRADVTILHHKLRNRPCQANRSLAVLSKMMNLAEQWGLRPDGSNPARHVRKYRETKRERYLTTQELRRLGRTLHEAQAEGTETPFALAAIALLVLTGARLSEVLTLRWAEVDLERQILRLTDSKTGAKTIYLNDAAAGLLGTMPRISGNSYVIAGKREGAHLVNLQKTWRRIRVRAGLNDVRIHDLRHSFASVAAGVGLSLPVIGKLLGHTQPVTTARYAHLAADPIRAASNLIGHAIASAMNGSKHTGSDHANQLEKNR